MRLELEGELVVSRQEGGHAMQGIEVNGKDLGDLLPGLVGYDRFWERARVVIEVDGDPNAGLPEGWGDPAY